MNLLKEGEEHVSVYMLFPGSPYQVRIPGPKVNYPILIVSAAQFEQQLLPVRGDRYDPRPHLAVICLYCGKQVSGGREDIDGVDKRVHDDLVKHQCTSCYVEGVAPEQYAKKYREILDRAFSFYSVICYLSYVCTCDILYPNHFHGFADHIPHCPAFVTSTKTETTKEAELTTPSVE